MKLILVHYNMADVHSKEVRSYNMSRIRGKNTKPEELVRKYLFSKGLRYRKNDKRYIGHPDIALPRYRTMVFVHGCFWHLHDNCRYSVMPKSNTAFWENKLTGNKSRDLHIKTELEKQGRRVIVVWECQLKKEQREYTLMNLYNEIIRQQDT